jgi:hypothetical protein
MDALAQTAGQVAMFLAPFLPRLLAVGEAIVEDAEQELREQGWEQAKAIWQRLGPKVDERPSAREAVEDAAAHPKDGDLQAALRVQIRKLLSEDRALEGDLTRLLQAGRQPGSVTTVTASQGGVAAGGNISGGTFITGDGNRLGE